MKAMTATERLLAKVGAYTITVEPRGTWGWIEGPLRGKAHGRVLSWGCEGKGRLAFDWPELITTAVRRKLVAYCRRIPSGPFGRTK
jgi:hypothetical protein